MINLLGNKKANFVIIFSLVVDKAKNNYLATVKINTAIKLLLNENHHVPRQEKHLKVACADMCLF